MAGIIFCCIMEKFKIIWYSDEDTDVRQISHIDIELLWYKSQMNSQQQWILHTFGINGLAQDCGNSIVNASLSYHCHNGQGQPPVGHRAKCLMSGDRGLPKPRHTHATTPVSRKHQFSSAKLHMSMFLDDITSCHDVPMTLTGVFTMLLDFPIGTLAGEIQFWVSVPL